MASVSLLLLLLPLLVSSVLQGWVESPGYPSGYLPHESLNWSRCAPKGHTLSFRLIHLDLEDSQDCENDAIKVRCQSFNMIRSLMLFVITLITKTWDFVSHFFKIFSNENLISILCGKKEFEELQSTVNPLLISTLGGCLSLSFYSDYSNIQRHAGFRGFYTEQGEKTRNVLFINICKHDSLQ